MRNALFALLVIIVLASAHFVSAAVIVNSSPGFGLAQVGGDGPVVPSGVVPDNLALASNGSTAFAIDVISGFSQHSIAHLNDGVYGNSNSWIGNSGRNITLLDPVSAGPITVNTGFAGVAAPTGLEYDISSFAFGRSNLGNEFQDRTAGNYYVQVTTAANPNASTADALWTTIGNIDITTNAFGDTYRHEFSLSSPVLATGMRIVVPTVGLGSGTDIDEIEINGRLVNPNNPSTPEPSTFVLGGICLVGLAVARRRCNHGGGNLSLTPNVKLVKVD